MVSFCTAANASFPDALTGPRSCSWFSPFLGFSTPPPICVLKGVPVASTQNARSGRKNSKSGSRNRPKAASWVWLMPAFRPRGVGQVDIAAA